MKILSIYDEEFNEYGAVIDGDFGALLAELGKTDCPQNGTVYVGSCEALEKCGGARYLQDKYFGGLPVEVGYCNGHNQLLNCLEYHKSSEINITDSDMILLLGRLQDVKNGEYQTAKIKAFLVPAGKGVELYSTSMHFAPCGVEGSGFRVIVVLPKGTNYEKPEGVNDPLLFANNKWLIAHKDAPAAKKGAHVGLIGENIKV